MKYLYLFCCCLMFNSLYSQTNDCIQETTFTQTITWIVSEPITLSCPPVSIDLGTNPTYIPSTQQLIDSLTTLSGGCAIVGELVVDEFEFSCTQAREISYSVSDECGNAANCSFTLTWEVMPTCAADTLCENGMKFIEELDEDLCTCVPKEIEVLCSDRVVYAGNGQLLVEQVNSMTCECELVIFDPPTCDVVAGSLAGGPFTFCVGDGIPDTIAGNDIDQSNFNAPNTQWLVTDTLGIILGLPNDYTAVDFDAAGLGTCLLWNIAFDSTLSGLAVGARVSDLQGCYDLSNLVEINRINCDTCNCENPPILSGSTLVDLDCQELLFIPAINIGSVAAQTDSLCNVDTLYFIDEPIIENGCLRTLRRTYVAQNECGDLSTTFQQEINWIVEQPIPENLCFTEPIDLGNEPNSLPNEDQVLLDVTTRAATLGYTCILHDFTATLFSESSSCEEHQKHYQQKWSVGFSSMCGTIVICELTYVWSIDITPCDTSIICDERGNRIREILDATSCSCIQDTLPSILCDSTLVCDGNGNIKREILDPTICACITVTMNSSVCNEQIICDANGTRTKEQFNPATCACEVVIIDPPICNTSAVCDGNGQLTIEQYDPSSCGCITVVLNTPNCNTAIACDGSGQLTQEVFDTLTCSCKTIDLTPTICDTATVCENGRISKQEFDQMTCSCKTVILSSPICNAAIICDGTGIQTREVYDSLTCACQVEIINAPLCDTIPRCNSEGELIVEQFNPVSCGCISIMLDPPNCNRDTICIDGNLTTQVFDTLSCSCVSSTIETNCNDNNPNTIDSYNPATCTCENVLIEKEIPPSCGTIDFSVDTKLGAITINNLEAPISIIQVFDENWQLAYNCVGDCKETHAIPLANGNYIVSVRLFTAAWKYICGTKKELHLNIKDIEEDAQSCVMEETCGEITVSYGNGTIELQGQADQKYIYKLAQISPVWKPIIDCAAALCDSKQTFTDLAAGTYTLRVWTDKWGAVCAAKEIQLGGLDCTITNKEEPKDSSMIDNNDDTDTKEEVIDNPTEENDTTGTQPLENEALNQVNCGELNIQYGNGSIQIDGVSGQSYYFKVLKNFGDWSYVTNCLSNCGHELQLTDLEQGKYSIQIFSQDWQQSCPTFSIDLATDDFGINSTSQNRQRVSNVLLDLKATTNNDNDFRVYPNPTNGQIAIKLDNYAGKPGTIELRNQLGQLVQQWKYQKLPTNTIPLKLKTVQESIYFLTLRINQQRLHTKKLLIQHR